MEPKCSDCPAPSNAGTPPGGELLLARKKSRLEEMLGLYRRAAEHLQKPEGPHLEKLSELMREVERIREEINTLDEEISREKNSSKSNWGAGASNKANNGNKVNIGVRNDNLSSNEDNNEIKSEIKRLLVQISKIHEQNISLVKKIHENAARELAALHQGKKAVAYLQSENKAIAVRLDDIR